MPFLPQIEELIDVLAALRAQAAEVEQMVALIGAALADGHTLYTCGNGGSSTDAIHLAQELVGRYRSNRRPVPAISLNADTGALTCIANDFGYEQVFARQLAALAKPGDVLVVFSTSGNSPNILHALDTARARGVVSVALLGKDGGAACTSADHVLIVPSHSTPRIQEIHTLLLHAICEEVEARIT
ncbi:MAG: SIS domain-containing protein [Chloroflexaceae bacterium]|nr:SIS domain-containing protein [Chloroflexaceae bacterium]